jgi:uncharacterized membrane-anchored protein
MRRTVIAIGAVLVLAAANFGIYRNEQVLASGRTVLLELAPVDPRSLMQGDYMALRFRVADGAFRDLSETAWQDGRIVLTIDPRNVGTFARFDDGSPLAGNEAVMRYRVRGGSAKFATNAFFFQEGHASFYETARYGEFRVSPEGEALLVAMRGEQLETLGPPGE